MGANAVTAVVVVVVEREGSSWRARRPAARLRAAPLVVADGEGAAMVLRARQTEGEKGSHTGKEERVGAVFVVAVNGADREKIKEASE